MSTTNTASSHTPGPWAIGIPDVHDPLADIAFRTISHGPDTVAVVLDAVHDDGASIAHQMNKANAALIATAPDLLAALIEAEAAALAVNRGAGETVFNPTALAIIREAIAKAQART